MKKTTKLIKLLLSAVFLVTLAGCNNTEYKYLGDDPKDITLNCEKYSIKFPTNTIYGGPNMDTYKIDYLKDKDNEEKEMIIAVMTNVPDKKLNIEDIGNNYMNERYDSLYARCNLYIVQNVQGYKDKRVDANFTNKYTEKNIGEYKTLVDQGTVQSVKGFQDTGKLETIYDKKFNYIAYDFFLDKDENYPCEVFVYSREDHYSKEEMKECAEEFISTIQEIK